MQQSIGICPPGVSALGTKSFGTLRVILSGSSHSLCVPISWRRPGTLKGPIALYRAPPWLHLVLSSLPARNGRFRGRSVRGTARSILGTAHSGALATLWHSRRRARAWFVLSPSEKDVPSLERLTSSVLGTAEMFRPASSCSRASASQPSFLGER